MVRRKLTLRVDADVIQKAKNAGMNLSYFLEVKLVEYLTRQSVLNTSMLPSGFEPESTAREAVMIGRYTTGASECFIPLRILGLL